MKKADFDKAIDRCLQRDRSLRKKIEGVHRVTYKMFVGDQEIEERAQREQTCDNISDMYDAGEIWRKVINSAIRDFLTYHTHSDKWNLRTAVGRTYVSAWGLIFRDDYTINFDAEECSSCAGHGAQILDGKPCTECKGQGLVKSSKPNRQITLQKLFDICKEGANVCKLRGILAKETKDPKLIERFCQEERKDGGGSNSGRL